MSGFVSAVLEAAPHAQVVAHAAAGQVVNAAAGSNGILDWFSAETGKLHTVLRAFSVVGGVGFVIMQALVSRGALARIIISGLAAGVFIYIVWNVTQLESRVNNEVNGSAVIGHQQVLGRQILDGHPVVVRVIPPRAS